jgi:hypothetical protein
MHSSFAPLLIRGQEVLDLSSEQSANPHKLTDFAKVQGTHLSYPSPHPLLL